MLRKTVLIRALSIAFSVSALGAVAINPVMAQSNAAGSIFGKVAPGASVVMKNLGTNQTRTITADSTGKFQASALAIGSWQVTSGGQTATVEVIAGQGAEAVLETAVAASASTGVQQVQISGRRSRIDVSNATNGAVFTARELAKLPIARNVDAIIQLAPNTTKGDPTYSAGASFAGGGVSENAYYINGFPTTNPLTQLGASELPFGAIAQATVLVGGFGAEFGRSVGGVVNITGKSGTNNWEMGALASITPKSLRSEFKDRYFAHTGATSNGPGFRPGATPTAAPIRNGNTDDSLRVRRQENKVGSTQVGAYVGGPIIADRLFMFASIEETKTKTDRVFGSRTSTTLAQDGYLNEKTTIDRYYAKFDANITDNHRLELSFIGDTPTVDSEYRGYTYQFAASKPFNANAALGNPLNNSTFTDPIDGIIGSKVNSSTHEKGNTLNNPNGAEVQILRYTGNLTDNLTLTSLYGQSKVKKIYEPGGYNANLFAVTAAANAQAPGLNYNSPQSFSGSIPLSGATDTIKFARADLEWTLGTHTLRTGFDNIKVASKDAGNVNAGGGTWTYAFADAAKPLDLGGINLPIRAGMPGLAGQGYYVGKGIFTTASNSFSAQNAVYLEDKWRVTKNLLVSYGVRTESFSNSNSAGEKFVEIKNQITPRISASWDVNGDSSLKVFGSAGRYAIQIPNVVALRAANGSTNTNQYFTYTGTDANGIPTGLTQLTVPYSVNGEYGQPRNATVVASQSIKPAFQDEVTAGFEMAFSPNLNFGGKVTHRSLKSTLDDVCDERPAERYAARNKINLDHFAGFGCAIFNTGEAGDFYLDFAGDGKLTLAHLTAEDLGFVKPKRTYTALDVFAEHPFRNGWYGKVNYTLARSTGNTEGQTRSDGNGGQADVAQTATSDYPEYDLYADGLLPNDRRHQIKAFGFYELTPQWSFGGNVILGSGRPLGCTGKNPSPTAGSPNYASERYCGGVQDYTTNVATPRGTTGRLPWEKTLDLNVVYKPEMVKGLSLKADIFNVFNDQSSTRFAENRNLNSGAVLNTHNAQLNSQAPRSVKFSAEFNHKF